MRFWVVLGSTDCTQLCNQGSWITFWIAFGSRVQYLGVEEREGRWGSNWGGGKLSLVVHVIFHVFVFFLFFWNRRRSWTSANVSASARRQRCSRDYSTPTLYASTITGRWRWPGANTSSSWRSLWRPGPSKRKIFYKVFLWNECLLTYFTCFCCLRYWFKII